MSTITPILARASTSISELKKNPMGIIDHGEGQPVAVLNRNQPVFYCIPAEAYERMLDKLEDLELAEIVKERQNDKRIKVNLDDL